jgi:DNA-binding MarR family transcriptional regulator
VLLGEVADALKDAGLPPLAWYDVLLELNRGQPLRPFELGRAVLLPKYNLSRLLDRLEAEGLIQRSDCPEDRRGQSVSITTVGRDLLRRMWPVYGAVIRQRFEEKLGPEEIDTLDRILRKLL